MNNKWINRIGNALLIISILFIGIALYRQDIQIISYINNINDICVYFFILFIYIASIYISSDVYHKILQIFTREKINKCSIREVYISSNLGKYLPGNVMHFIGRNVLATKYGISQSNMVIATVLELVLVLFVSTLIVVGFAYEYIISVFVFLIKEYLGIIIIFCCIGVVLLILLIITYLKLKDKINKIIREIDLNESKKVLIQCMSIDFIIQLVSSSTYIMVILTVYDGHVQSWFNLLGIYLIAWIVGFVMPGVPGGIGIKETILILLLNDIFPKDIILVSVVLHRCLNIIAEVLAFIIMKIIMFYKCSTQRMDNKNTLEK